MFGPTFRRSLLLSCALVGNASCEALFGGLSQDNPESCVANAALCRSPDEICNAATRSCEPALRIDSVSPAAAPFDTELKVTLTGKNFVPNLALSIAGVPAKDVTFISESQLSAITPASHVGKDSVPLELVAPSTQRYQRDGLFHYFPWPTFATPTNTVSPGTFKVLRSADFNRDGRPDVAMAADNTSPVAIFLGQADGSLLPAGKVSFSSRPFGMALGDVNADGKIDIAISETGPQFLIEVALGNGDGTFAVVGSVNTSTTVSGLALIDVSGDRKADLVVADGLHLVVHPSVGDGTFGSPVKLSHTFQSMDVGSSLADGDLNGDGRIDVVALNGKESRFPIYLSKGDGSFSEAKPVTFTSVLSLPVLVDVNKDGRLDLACFSRNNGQVVVFLGDGTGGFAVASVTNAVMATDSIGVGDLNGDGTVDLVTVETNMLAETFVVLAGTGTGQFQRSESYQIGPSVLAAALYVGDLTADGKLDVLIGQRTGKLSLFKNVTP
jgi:hypothetical protein